MLYIISDDIRGRHGRVRRTDNVRILVRRGRGERGWPQVLTPVQQWVTPPTSQHPTINGIKCENMYFLQILKNTFIALSGLHIVVVLLRD